MSAASWAAYLTSLPGRIIGSLGPTKRDLAPVGSHTYYEPAQEKELIRNWVGWLAECVGLPSGYAAGSVQGRLDALEGTAAAFMNDPDYYFFSDNFDGSGVDTLYWDGGGVSLPGLNDDPPGLKLLYSAELLAQFTRNLWKRSKQPHVRCRVMVHDPIPAGSGFSIGWRDNDGHVNAEVRFNPTMPSIEGVRASNGNGGTVATAIGGWVEDTAHLVDFWIDGTYHLWVKLDSAAAVDCGIVFNDDLSHLEIWGPHEDANPGYTVVSALRTWSGWGP